MSFIRTATKTLKDIPHRSACLDNPDDGKALEPMMRVLERCMDGETVTILVRGERRTIKTISYIFDRMDVFFTNGEKHLMRPEDVVKVSGVTK